MGRVIFLQNKSNIVDIGVESTATGKIVLQKTLDVNCDCWFDVGDEIPVALTGIITGADPLLASAVRIKPLDDGISWTMYLNEFKNNQLSPY